MLRDFRFAFRVLAAKPLFTLVAALSLGLGIGANSAIFSLVDTLWFRPLAVPDSGKIVRLFSVTEQSPEGLLSYPEYLDFQRQATTLSDVAAVGGRGLVLIEGDSHTLHNLNMVSSNFFTALGVKPLLGRVFTPRDETDSPGSLVVVLGNSFWQRHYGGDPAIVGKQIHVQRGRLALATVIGVLPASFRGIERQGDRDLWFPRQSWTQLGDSRELETRGSRWFYVVGRLAPGTTAQTANAQIQTIARRIAEESPATNRGRRASVVTDFDHRMKEAGNTGLALISIVLLVVMISSVNVANLLLSRAGVRGKEMAVRLALGASRGRVIRQLMAENFLLGAVGLVMGLALGALLISILPSLMIPPPGFDAGLRDFQFDSRVLTFSLIVSLATVLFFGLAPAWKSARPDLLPALKGEAAMGASRRWRWPLRNWLVVAQVGVSLTLLACAGVLVHSFMNTRLSDLGFGRKQLLLVWLSHDAKPPLYRDVISRFEGMPGVRSVAAAVRAPLSLSSNGMFQRAMFPDLPEFANAPPFEIKYNSVTANFLSTMGTPIVRGRGYEARDEIAGATSVVINEYMAQRFWPREDPIGKMVRIGGPQGKLHTVIGVAKNAPINEVGELSEPYLYMSYWANFETEVTFLIETKGDAIALAQPARHLLKTVDARLEPLTITTQNDLIRFSAQGYQMTAELVGALGLLGLILTAVGLYGVVSYGVSQRTRELGIRMALGAGRGDTMRLVLREVAMLGLIGVLAGIPLSLWATRMFSSLLFGVRPWDIPAFAGALLVLAVVLFAAGFFPARRATGIDPGSALRVT
jgi:predicted permease